MNPSQIAAARAALSIELAILESLPGPASVPTGYLYAAASNALSHDAFGQIIHHLEEIGGIAKTGPHSIARGPKYRQAIGSIEGALKRLSDVVLGHQDRQ